jgi:phospholipid transport system substrate-binding protein
VLNEAMAMTYIRCASVVFLYCLLVGSHASAGEPLEALKSWIQEVQRLTGDPALQSKDRERELQDRVRESQMTMMDVDEMAKQALGTHWDRRTPAEQKEFIGLFRGIVEIVNTPIPFKGEPLPEFVFDREVIDQGFAEVETHIVNSPRRDVPVLYKLRFAEGKWKIYDWVVFGVGLTKNYRAQFSQVITKSSFEELIRLLREKNQKNLKK